MFLAVAILGALPRPLAYLANRASLRAALSSAYLCQMALAIGLSAGLAWRAIDRTGLHLARQQQAAIALHVADRIRDDMRDVRELERAARDALALGLWSEMDGLERWLWQSARIREPLAIGARTRDGGSLKVARQSDGSLVSLERLGSSRPLVAYRLDDSGERLEPISLTAVERLVQAERLFADLETEAAALPVVRIALPEGTNEATASVLLSAIFPTDDLEQLLERLYVGDRGLVAVVDRDGQLVASSNPSVVGSASRSPVAETATATLDVEARRKLDRAIAALHTDAGDTPLNAATPRRGELRFEGRRYQVSLSPVELSGTKPLWIVTALADRDFGQVGYRDVLGFLAFGLVATLVVGAVNLIEVRATIRAIAKLKGAIEKLGMRRWSQVELGERPPEFRQVNASLVEAARRLQTAFEALRARNTILERNQRFKTWLLDDSVQRLSSLQDSIASRDADCGTVKKTTKQTLSLLENAAELNQLQLQFPALPLQSVALDICIDAAIVCHGDELDAHGIELVRHDAPMPVFVCADPRKLERVLDELLENAIQFSHDGSTISISTSLAVSAVRSSYHDLPEVSVSIADNGTGIDPEEQHKLFQPFARLAHHDSDRCGYGLGLAIAERTMVAMGGRLEIHSEGRDRGTVARITMPVASANGTIPIDEDEARQPPREECEDCDVREECDERFQHPADGRSGETPKGV